LDEIGASGGAARDDSLGNFAPVCAPLARHETQTQVVQIIEYAISGQGRHRRPVGSGKTALTLALCRALRTGTSWGREPTNIYTEEDAQFLVRTESARRGAHHRRGTGGCPHTASAEDAR